MPETYYDEQRQIDWIDDGSGHRRYLACLPKRATCALPRFPMAPLPRSQWKEVSYRYLAAPILDQDGHGSCVGHGSCTAFDVAWRLGGGTPQPFSACFLYGLINGGQDQGAVVSDALEALKSSGIALETEVPEGMIYKRQFPASSFQTANRFKILEAYAVDNFDLIASAVQLGFPVSFGIEIGQAFEPDSQGIIPDQRGGGGGHCMAGIGLRQLNGRWYIEVQNSWGTRWGQSGYCFMPESYFGRGTDAWAVQAEAEDPSETNLPPVVKG